MQDGETVALLGPSGTGKSVMLKHVIGLIRPDAGQIFVDGLAVGRLKRDELAELRTHRHADGPGCPIGNFPGSLGINTGDRGF